MKQLKYYIRSSELHDKSEVHQYVTAHCKHVVKNCDWMFHSCDIHVPYAIKTGTLSQYSSHIESHMLMSADSVQCDQFTN